MSRMITGLLLALTLCALTTTVYSQHALYLGGGIGNSFVGATLKDAGDLPYSYDKSAVAWKLFTGYRLLYPFVGIEGGYRSLGKISTTQGQVVLESKTTGWDVGGLGVFSISFVDLFGKASAFFYKTEATAANFQNGANGTAFLWGLGAGVHLGTLGLRLEWENIEVDNPSKLSVVWGTITLGF